MIDMLKTSQEVKDRQTSFIICLTVASIVKAAPLNEINLTEEQQRVLCRAFLIQASEDGSSCFEVEMIDKHYNTKQRYIEYLRQVIILYFEYNSKVCLCDQILAENQHTQLLRKARNFEILR